MTLLAQHLWRDVVGGAAECPLPLAIRFDASGEAEVSEFDLQEKDRSLPICRLNPRYVSHFLGIKQKHLEFPVALRRDLPQRPLDLNQHLG